MRKRFKLSNLNRFLGHEAVSSEIASSHAYGRAARVSRSIPRVRRASSPRGNLTVASYRDSMVGSVAQYRDKVPVPPRAHKKEQEVEPNEEIIGNRPHSMAADREKADNTPAKRHHFVEPPKRSFYHFD